MSGTTTGWLLDTNVVSEGRRLGGGNPGVRAWIASVPASACHISLVSIAEIRRGVEGAPDPALKATLRTWFDSGVRPWFSGRVLPVDEEVLLVWRQFAVAGQRSGYTYSQPDALIAATALVHGLHVVTRNVRDFQYCGVPVLNPWTP